MSRVLPRCGAASPRPGQEDDICPVCKSSRYLNPNMRFLVNPECYHKMCESCVDRIFSQGPAPCPVAGCARTLRKQRFRKQTFEDLKIEREVDIRARVAAVFNRRESEFTTLLAYNNYLEEVETLTFNLIHRIDVPTTEAKLNAYASANAQTIAHNASLTTQESATTEAHLAAQKAAAQLRRAEARKEESDERREREEGRREIVNSIANTTGDADQIARETQSVVLKKSTARRTARQQQQSASHVDNGAPPPLFEIQGLKPVVQPAPEKAYDPFGGLVMRREYYTLRQGYEHPWLEKARTDTGITAGGYDVGEYCGRATLEAFAGLGVFVEAEVAAREGDVVGTASAAAAATEGR